MTASRIIKGVLSEQDIISAPLAPAGTREGLARLIGGKVMSLANRLGMVKSHSGGKKHEAEEHHGGAAMSHSVGGMKACGGKKGLASRLM